MMILHAVIAWVLDLTETKSYHLFELIYLKCI